MKTSITKDEAAWLAIRIAGMYFAWLALSELGDFIYTAHLLTTEGLREIRESLSRTLSWELAWPKACGFIIHGSTAIYLLRFGSTVHRLICAGQRTPQASRTALASQESQAE
jgi:hypothetical protein